MRLISWLLCLSVASLAQASEERNPFIETGLLCEEVLSALDGWHLRGVMVADASQVALMQHGKTYFVRVTPGTMLMPEVMIKAVSVSRVTAMFCGICDGAHYHWFFSGGKDVPESDLHSNDTATADRPDKPAGDAGR